MTYIFITGNAHDLLSVTNQVPYVLHITRTRIIFILWAVMLQIFLELIFVPIFKT